MAPGFAGAAIVRGIGWLRRGGEPEPPAFDGDLLRSVLGGGRT